MAEHYFTKQPASRVRFFIIKAKLRNRIIEFYSAPGVFSKNRVDLGSQLLINKCIIKPASKILDLGCGFGAIGVTLAKCFPRCEVVLSDINQRAVTLARKNIKHHKLQNAWAKQSDALSKLPKDFDHILLNPPQAAGKKLCFQLIEESREHLKEKGTLQLVARSQKGGKSLSRHMEEVFDNVKTIAKKSGFRIYSSTKLL